MTIERDVFASGEYVEHFQPDQTYNPFHQIYAAKREDIVASVRSTLPAGGTVLDLGGAMGRMAVPLARDYRVTLCDISPDMLRLAEAAASESRVPAGNLTTQCVDASAPLPFPTARFDRALSIDLLVHLPDPVATLRELRRVLKPDGELLVDISNSAPWWLLGYPRHVGLHPRRWLRALQGGGIMPEWQGIVHHYTRVEFYEMLAAAGFTAVQEWRYGPAWCAKWFLTRCRRLEG